MHVQTKSQCYRHKDRHRGRFALIVLQHKAVGGSGTFCVYLDVILNERLFHGLAQPTLWTYCNRALHSSAASTGTWFFNLNLEEVGRVQPPFLTGEMAGKCPCSLQCPMNIGKFSFPSGVLTIPFPVRFHSPAFPTHGTWSANLLWNYQGSPRALSPSIASSQLGRWMLLNVPV